jgi:hypothetical protein
MSLRPCLRLALPIVLLCGATGCMGTPARMPDIASQACRAGFSDAIAAMLVEHDERPDVARRAADRAVESIIDADLGPRGFEVSTNYPADYDMIVTLDKSRCVLTLFGLNKGGMSISGTVPIESKPFSGCLCTE